MSKGRLVISLLLVLGGGIYIGILHGKYRVNKIQLEVANKQVISLEAQISSVLKEHEELAELYLNISNRLRYVRFDTLQATLRLEDTVLNSEPESDLAKWSSSALPKEVKEVLSNMGRNYDTGTKSKD